jgi:hypothetical protein
MNPKKSNKQKNSQRQRFTLRIGIIAGFSVAAIAAGIFFYIQITKTEPSKADDGQAHTMEQLPVEMIVDQMVIALPDTNNRNGARYKVAKPLSLTPQISK